MHSSSQVPMDGFLSFANGESAIWSDSFMIPTHFALASSAVLLLHVILLAKPIQKIYAWLLPTNVSPEDSVPQEEGQAASSAGFFAEAKVHVLKHGGPVIFAYKIARLIGCLTFLGFSLATLILEENDMPDIDQWSIRGKWGKKPRNRHGRPNSRMLSEAEWLQVAVCLSALYASLLAVISVSARPRWSGLVTKHLNSLMVVILGVYCYRDLWPLTTFTVNPRDTSEGWMLFAKVTVLFVTAVIIPLFMPRQYSPVDPKNPMPEPNPEQTVSLFSLLIYTFLDPIVFLAYRIPHLPHAQLPPLADYDYTKNLSEKASSQLDPFIAKTKSHIFFRLMTVFRREYITLALMLVLQVLAGFANPVGINRLLNYLETGGRDAVVRPWVWIAWLFIGPTIGSIAFQWYIFIATRTLVRTESIMTQLIFDHSLRIRMKAEVSKTPASGESTAAPSPDRISTPDANDGQEPTNGNGEETLRSSSASITSTGSKGKQKAKDTQSPEENAKTSKAVNAGNLVGKINNLVTTDLNNITNSRDFLYLFIYIPLQISLCIWFLYIILGGSSFVGLAVMLLLFPLPGYIAKLVQDVQAQTMKKTDARVQNVTEAMGVIRMIKLFGWESKMNQRIAEEREEELKWVWKRQLLDLLNGNINYVIPLITMVATYSTYTVILKQELSASKVFSSMSVFDMLREQLHIALFVVTQSMRGKVSLDRIDDFLRNTELLDEFSKKTDDDGIEILSGDGQFDPEVIGIRDAVFSWSSEKDGSLTPSRRPFNLRIDGELVFKPGCINLIIGHTGSGKTSLLMALLGEMHFIPSGPMSSFNLPRDKGVAYAAQESWVQNETIRENIVFGAPFDEERYQKVLYQCALQRDMSLFEAGDRTEVGEKGLTLSGGQKARITLARAVYSSANTLLLDDVLAALDVHTAKWIVEKCFSGDLIRGRTVLLVTHNVAITSSISHFVISIGKDGRIHSKGSVSDVLAKDKTLAAEAIEDEQATQKAEGEVDPAFEGDVKEADGKLVVKEEIEEGHVSWSALKLYLSSMSRSPGFHPFFFWFTFLGGMILSDVCNTVQTWYLGYWASQYADHDPSEVAVPYYLTIYSLLLLASIVLYSSAYLAYVFGSLRASRKIHLKLVESVLGTTLRWLDTTPTARVIARCTQDIAAVDGPISQGLGWLSEMTLSMLIKFGAVVLFTPIFVIPGLVLAFLGGLCGQIYIKAQLSVKREMSNARSPVLGHFGAAIAGLTSIRAYGAQLSFRKESMDRIDRYTRAARTFYNLNRWVCIRIDAMGGLFAAGLAWYLVYGRPTTPGNTGFSLNQAVSFSSMILWWVRVLNDFEVNGNSLERIQGYITIEQEPKPTAGGNPPAYWPASGDIRVENLSARYSKDGPNVLHNLNFHIKSGERVGIVGRTGSGKSTLTLSLLRCIFTEGTAYFDGIPTNTINLEALRTNITIIPQIPELISGSLRGNLDPFDQFEDSRLNDALRAAGLFSLQSEGDEGRITLDTVISTGGSNLSVGQRQILALARAILRGSKLLILDEATSAIDYKTDSIIQSSLRNRLADDVTLLTVAHRLQTIMDADKIMVLDAGRIVEFDKPSELLKNEKSMLRALVDESADKDVLYEMARDNTDV